MNQFNRRSLLGGLGGIGVAGALTAVAGDAHAFNNNTTPAAIPNGFSLYTTATDAAAGPTTLSKAIQALSILNGKLVYGYGDYDKNSGSMGNGTNLSAIDLATKTQITLAPNVRTEAFLTLRNQYGHIFAPVIDQTDGNQVFVDTTINSTNVIVGPGMEHTFDVCAVWPKLIAVGSGDWNGQHGAIAYQYNLNTKTWKATPAFAELSDVPADENYDRYYWCRSIGPYVFAQLGYGEGNDLIRYNTTNGKLDKLPNIQVSTMSANTVDVFDDILIVGNGYTVIGTDQNGNTIFTKGFNGFIISVIACDDGYLYVTTSEGIYRSFDLDSWETYQSMQISYSTYQDIGWSSVAIDDNSGKMYMGGDHGRILVSNFTITD